MLKIPRAIESSHVLVMGDSGTGKSALIRHILQQLEDRGDTAIVYDPALEYTPQFYMPERGDAILNPIDARSPYWSPGDELRHEAEALTLATSLFPDRANENPFFTEGPRRIFAHLLTFRPTAEELASWLCHDEELDRRVHATPYASIIGRQAPAQRSGVLAALNMVADTLKLLPRESETTRRWSAESWARDRRGWLFLTSTPETRTRLVPLTSLWLDMLVLRLMNRGQPGHRPVWFVLDELASLQRLPQLHTAVTENRKSNNPVVLGFQGRSQLETRYGHDAEAMLSQPATKVFLRTSEPHAAKWISDTIGEVEIERMREKPVERATRATELRPGTASRAAGDAERDQWAPVPTRLPEVGEPGRPTALSVPRSARAVSRVRRTVHRRAEATADRNHRAMQCEGHVSRFEHRTTVLSPRQEITGADRQWAERYEEGDVIRYSRGSKVLSIEAGDYARVAQVDAKANHITVRTDDDRALNYDPRRLQGVTLYRETERAFAAGDRVQMTAPDRERGVPNRELGTVERVRTNGRMDVRWDSGRASSFEPHERRHLEYGYAVTSHSSQGQTAGRVLVHVETERASEKLVNQRLAYVAVSRGQHDARIYTDDKVKLTRALGRDVSHRSALEQSSTPASEPGTHSQISRRESIGHTMAVGS